MERCFWVGEDELYQRYHDEEWGVPVYEDQQLFELLCLEGMQAGLSWLTVLKKRENYRLLFENFCAEKVSGYGEEKIKELAIDPRIIRHELKVRAIVSNAKAYLEVQKEFGSFSAYVWSFVEGKPILHEFQTREEMPSESEISKKMSKDLKKRGFKFIGSTICYAFMQAAGLVNDHMMDCFCYPNQQKKA